MIISLRWHKVLRDLWLNVLERTREIGVMRAIDASNRSVWRIFILEGIIIGLIGWLVGAALAYTLSKLLSDLIGHQFLNAPLIYTSFLPAWNASRITVREVLAYE